MEIRLELSEGIADSEFSDNLCFEYRVFLEKDRRFFTQV